MRAHHPHVERLLAAATSDSGLPLQGSGRALMEDCFEMDLGGIRLHFNEASGLANQAFGSLAFNVGRHICFPPGFDASFGPAFTYVLAHEVAHAVQKYLGRQGKVQTNGDVRLLEAEAHRAAAAVLVERRVSRLTPDVEDEPRFWGPQGHYYTVLWASFAAGLNFGDAKRNAFFTQMPDQVRELDATPSGVFWGSDLGGSVYASLNAKALKAISFTPTALGLYLNGSPWIAQYWQSKSDELIDEAVVKWTVQAGLHSLTGNDPKDEQETRKRTLMRLKRDTFEFGLALHPYGDSFAHQDFTDHPKMYAAPAGHLLQGDNADNIHNRADKYLAYGEALYDLFVEKWEIKKPPVPKPDFLKALLDVAKEDKQEMQVAAIQGYAAIPFCYTEHVEVSYALDALDHMYRPEKAKTYLFGRAPQTWADFYAENHSLNDIPMSDGLLKRALECALQWVGGAKPCGLPPKEEIEARMADVALFVLEHPSYWP